MASYSAHLLVVCHGLWGTRQHIQYICRSIASQSSSIARPINGRDVRLVVLPIAANEWTNTYDGIDYCAERVVIEIDDECKRIEKEGGKVERFSIVGYSLGGLVARYALGLLESRTPSFFDHVKPVNFTTFASPAIGIPKYDSFWSGFLRFFGSRLLSRTGRQLYGNDRFLPSSIIEGNNQPSKAKSFVSRMSLSRSKARPLLQVLADPDYSFYKALIKFQKVDIYANGVNDRTVPYPTGAIEAHDPFSWARAKAKKSADARGEDEEYIPDITEGGLQVEYDKKTTIVKSWKEIEPVIPPPAPAVEGKPKKKKRRSIVPVYLRPSTYPFSRPFSWFLVLTLPISAPGFLLYLVGRFVVQSMGSRKRIKEIRKEMGLGREGMLARVGVRINNVVGQVAEQIQADNPETVISSSPSLESTQKDDPFKDIDEGALLAPRRSSVPFVETTISGTATPTPQLLKPAGAPTSANYATDPKWTPDQLEMIKNLNAIPQLKKHITFMPEIRHTHGVIVARDPNFIHAKYGKALVDGWASDFIL